jgi:transcriptional regulator with XRE-family HTH domain
MPKRDPEPEALPDEEFESEPERVGERLRVAREEKGLSLEDVAAQTRIPRRHLASIETGDWESLPAPTYTIGFAKSYASAVGLDRTEIGDQLREEMGGQRFASSSTDVFEAADPRRTMPKGLVIGAIVAVVILVAVMSYLNKRSLEQPDQQAAASTSTTSGAPGAVGPKPAPPAAQTQGQVVLTAVAPAWIQVTDQGRSLFEGTLQPGQTYTVPATATAPTLKAGKPEALTVTVNGSSVPQVGPPGKVTTVSLAPASLMKGPSAPAAQPARAETAAASPAATHRKARTNSAPAEPAPATETLTPTSNAQ